MLLLWKTVISLLLWSKQVQVDMEICPFQQLVNVFNLADGLGFSMVTTVHVYTME